MPALLTLDSLTLSTPDGRILAEDLSLAFGRERTGLVGRNGAGKSTLLAVMAGDVEPVAGHVQRAGSVGRLVQSWRSDIHTVAEALGVAGDLARLDRLERGEGDLDDASEADWTLPGRIEAAMADAGLTSIALDRDLASLTGGERMRVGIARLLIKQPDLLLLDEPTNNLDADGRAAVLELLANWRGGIVVASHDRALLEQVDRIVELAPTGVTVFGGGWSEFAEARDEARGRAEGELDRASRSLRQTQASAQAARERQARRDSAGRAKRARGDAPKILLDAKQDRAERTGGRGDKLAEKQLAERDDALLQARAKVEIVTPLSIDLPPSGLPCGRELIALDQVGMEHAGRRIFGPLSLDVRGPQRLAICGRNGAGKTTLMRLIAGEVEPSFGSVRRMTDRVARLDQDVSLLDPASSILDNMRRLNPGLSDNQAHAVLARFAFRNRAALQAAGTLSGGERLRAGLACTFAGPEPPWLLLLDEPTNHLDLAAIEELERALTGYDGALVVVSHDEAFLEAIGITKTVSL